MIVPNAPGVYAWYIAFDDEVDPSLADVASFKELMRQYRRHLEVADLDVSVTDTAFPVEWQGTARSPSLGSRRYLEQVEHGPEAVRKALWGALAHWAVPIFSSPLYIGKSTDLRARLQAHVYALRVRERTQENSLADSIPTHDAVSDESDEMAARNFAERCATKGIHLGRLQVFFRAAGDIAPAIAKLVVDGMEETLNSWYRPRLGRR